MLLLSRPSDRKIREFLSNQRNAPFSYSALAATRGEPPPDYTVDRYRVRLGTGREVFARAVEALFHWEMFHMNWVELLYPDTPIRIGETVAVLIRHFWIWSINPSRIVYTIEESGAVWRSGFAYGTLLDHSESGEERFLVEWSQQDDTVWYDVLAFSRPNHPLVRMAYPIARILQKRFARDSQDAMRRAVCSS